MQARTQLSSSTAHTLPDLGAEPSANALQSATSRDIREVVKLPLPVRFRSTGTLYQSSNPNRLVADLKSPSLFGLGVGLFLLGALSLGIAFAGSASAFILDSAFVLGITSVVVGFSLCFGFTQLELDREGGSLSAVYGVAIPFQAQQMSLAGFVEVLLKKQIEYLDGYGFFTYSVLLFNPEANAEVELDRRVDFIEARRFAVTVAGFLGAKYIEVVSGQEYREGVVGDEDESTKKGKASRSPRAAFYPESGALVVELAAPESSSSSQSALKHTVMCMVIVPLVTAALVGISQVLLLDTLSATQIETAFLGVIIIGAMATFAVLQYCYQGRRRERILVSHDRLRIEESSFLGTKIVEVSAADIVEILLPDQYLHPIVSTGACGASFVSNGISVRALTGSVAFGKGQSLDELIYIYKVLKRTLVASSPPAQAQFLEITTAG